jgi:PAS domain S-box-containing protein
MPARAARDGTALGLNAAGAVLLAAAAALGDAGSWRGHVVVPLAAMGGVLGYLGWSRYVTRRGGTTRGTPRLPAATAPPEVPGGRADDSEPSGVFTTADLICQLDPLDFRLAESSRAVRDFFGLSKGALRSTPLPDLVHPSHRDRVRAALQAAVISGEASGIVAAARAAGGRWKVISVAAGARHATDGKVRYLRCHLTDVTARFRSGRALRRRRAELARANAALRSANRALSELKDRYTDLYQNAPVMYLSLGPDGTVLDCNDTMVEALGVPREALVGAPYARLVAPEFQSLFPGRQAEFLRTGRLEVESRWVRADGRTRDVLVVATAVRDDEGRVLHSRTVAQDITRLKGLEAELRAQGERLRRAVEELSRKNKELDEFGFVVSHDLVEPVRTLLGFASFLEQDHAEALGEQGREYVHQLHEAALRMRSLVSALLNHSRAGRAVGAFEPVDLAACLDRVRRDLGALIADRGAEVVAVGTLPTLQGDPQRLAQVLANLVANGIKYNRAAVPRVEVAATVEPGASMATLAVRDNGIGIPPADHEKIFGLFRRLHAPDDYEGTGAGLAIVRKVVEAHGGTVRVESAPGAGATFLVRLPLLHPAVEDRDADGPAA